MNCKILTLIICSVLLLSCGNDKTQNQAQENQPEATAETQSVEQQTESKIELNLTGNDQMQYDKNELRVQSGQQVSLTLTNVGKMDKATMGHNFVLLKKGTDVDDFAKLALTAKSNDYIPNSSRIIAHTELIGGGESSTITFVAPEKGTYDYLCTFPGHYTLMQGKFIVE